MSFGPSAAVSFQGFVAARWAKLSNTPSENDTRKLTDSRVVIVRYTCWHELRLPTDQTHRHAHGLSVEQTVPQEHGLDLPAMRWPWSSTADAAGPLFYKISSSWHCWLFLDVPVSHYPSTDIVHINKKADNQQAYIDVFHKAGVTWCRAETREGRSILVTALKIILAASERSSSLLT